MKEIHFYIKDYDINILAGISNLKSKPYIQQNGRYVKLEMGDNPYFIKAGRNTDIFNKFIPDRKIHYIYLVPFRYLSTSRAESLSFKEYSIMKQNNIPIEFATLINRDRLKMETLSRENRNTKYDIYCYSKMSKIYSPVSKVKS